MERLWVTRSFVRIFIGVQGFKKVVDRTLLRKEDTYMFCIQFDVCRGWSLAVICPSFSRP